MTMTVTSLYYRPSASLLEVKASGLQEAQHERAGLLAQDGADLATPGLQLVVATASLIVGLNLLIVVSQQVAIELALVTLLMHHQRPWQARFLLRLLGRMAKTEAKKRDNPIRQAQ